MYFHTYTYIHTHTYTYTYTYTYTRDINLYIYMHMRLLGEAVCTREITGILITPPKDALSHQGLPVLRALDCSPTSETSLACRLANLAQVARIPGKSFRASGNAQNQKPTNK